MTPKMDSPAENITNTDDVYTIAYKKPVESSRKVSVSGSTASAADFEKAIREAGYGKFNYLILLLALPASCASTFCSTSLSYALPIATCDLNLDIYDKGYLNGVLFSGMITSAFFWGFISDTFGRQRALVFGYLGEVFFSIGASLSQSFWSLFIFRFLSGVMISGPHSIFMAYLSELFQVKHRDSVVMTFGLFQAVGGIIQSLFAWAIIPQNINWELLDGFIVINSWRVFLMVCTLPSLVAGIGIAFCHESPRFLLAKGRKDEALHVFRSIYSINSGRPAHTYSIRKLKRDLNAAETTRKASVYNDLTGLFRPPYLGKALFAFSIQFGTLSTMNTIKLWLPQLFSALKQIDSQEEDLNSCQVLGGNATRNSIDCDNFVVETEVYTNLMYVCLLTTISFSLCTAAVKKVGKRNVMVTLFMLQAATICFLGWVQPKHTVVLAAIFVALSNTSSIGVLGFVVQMFPTNYRTMAVSLTMMFGRVGVCIGNAFLAFFLALSCQGTFVGIGVINLFCGFALFALAAIVARSEANKKAPPAA